ncbi:3-keto-5-aminohexanoate cleavage protein [Burkholderia pyrrocinia]|uniref:3-keto-5-aminohexanoate cleavage protein n=1 Tax=Burkholderia pyrrocinia TaxID=60550 RepID=UPI00158D80A4|nr:3-keto-5-aminohexanoate cleavage protein [Burkholderia pyrrocinia]
MTRMYITAAPVGAVPKWLDPLEPTFVPSYLLHYLLDPAQAERYIGQLQADGWEAVEAGGLLIEEGHGYPICENFFAQLPNPTLARSVMKEAGWTQCQQGWSSPKSPSFSGAVIPRDWLEDVSSVEIVRRIVLQLTTYGWTASERGDLVWHHAKLHSYLPPVLVRSIRKDCPGLLARLHEAGWQPREAGYWQAGKGRSPFLPITPAEIAAETIRSMKEGAAVVHLHTRELGDRTQLEIPGLGTITTGAQRNQIKVEHYDAIVPAVKNANPTAILNFSTSVRGDRHGARDILRRAHLKSYAEVDGPEIASLSPAAVIFQGGGGYDNAPDFLAAQFEHFRRVGTRPEVEVFNHTIVNNATTLYRELLESVGQPVLFMLVAGVDQYFRDPISGEVEDDSLIAPAIRQEIATHLSSTDEQGRQRAIDLAVKQLQPVVERLRQSFPFSLISLLLPGPLQTLLADLAQALRLDGVRIGLEDGLNVIDRRVPGGVRKALGTWEQVRMLRNELLSRGITIQTSTDVREMLGLTLAASVPQHLKRA